MIRLDPFTRRLIADAPQRAVSVMYHAVTTEPHPWPWSVCLKSLREQLDFLHENGYISVTTDELIGQSGQHGQRIAITFDDGYADTLKAVEELLSRNMQATWFVVTGSLGCPPTWTDAGRPSVKMLSATDLREMQQAGMEIGSHTVNHSDLTRLSPEQLKRELVDSRKALEDILGTKIIGFAYPYGQWSPKVEIAVKAAGYRYACTTRTGWALLDNNPFRIRRLTINNTDSLSQFARKLAFASHEIQWSQIAAYGIRRLQARFIRETK